MTIKSVELEVQVIVMLFSIQREIRARCTLCYPPVYKFEMKLVTVRYGGMKHLA